MSEKPNTLLKSDPSFHVDLEFDFYVPAFRDEEGGVGGYITGVDLVVKDTRKETIDGYVKRFSGLSCPFEGNPEDFLTVYLEFVGEPYEYREFYRVPYNPYNYEQYDIWMMTLLVKKELIRADFPERVFSLFDVKTFQLGYKTQNGEDWRFYRKFRVQALDVISDATNLIK